MLFDPSEPKGPIFQNCLVRVLVFPSLKSETWGTQSILPSGAEALVYLVFFGTSSVMPFQNFRSCGFVLSHP
jgi:hypothetical protein